MIKNLWQRIWPFGIRLHLTLWFLGVFSLLFLLCSAVFFLTLQSFLLSNVDTILKTRAEQMENIVINADGNFTFGNLSHQIQSDPDQRIDDASGHYSNTNFISFIRLIDAHKHIFYSTPAFSTLVIPDISITQPLYQHLYWLGTVETINKWDIRVQSLPLYFHNNVIGVMQIGTSLDQVEHTLHGVIIELLIIAPLFLSGGGAGCYWLAGRAFRPIVRLTDTALAIKEGNIQQRVPVTYTGDEVQHLALTFNEMLDQLEKTLANQRRFIADASHELRMPVAAIRSMTDIALEQNVTEGEAIGILQDINEQSEHLTRLITDLLVLARADEGHIPMEYEIICLSTLVQDVVATMEWLAHERAITLTTEIEKPVYISGDEARLMQMVMNIIDNALRYTSANGKVTVTLNICQQNVQLSISDTGCGIAPEHLEHIFKRFYRVDSARSRAEGGTGLGLALVDWIVRVHHGTISVESEPGQGTTVTILLPLISK